MGLARSLNFHTLAINRLLFFQLTILSNLERETVLFCALSARVHVLRLIPCRAYVFASCKKHLSRYSCASLAPLGMKRACICARKLNVLGDVSVLCVFVRVAM